MLIILKIAIRNVFRHKTRSIITLSSIAFGCIAIIFVGGFFEDILIKMRDNYIKALTGHIQVYKTGYFEKGAARPYNYLIDNPDEVISIIKTVSGIRMISSRLVFSGLLSTGDITISFIGQGIEPQNEKSVKATESELTYMFKNAHKNKMLDESTEGGIVVNIGEPLAENDTYSVLLGKGLAKSIDARVEDNLVILTNTVGGSINAIDINVKGTFFTTSKTFDDIFLRLPLATAQKLLNTQGIHALVIRLNKTKDTAKVKNELIQLFKKNNLDLEVKTWDELSDYYTKSEELFKHQFFILKLVMAIVVILSIFNTMNMAVLERISEIGTMRSLGAKRRNVISLFLWEGLALGIIGGLIGVIAGALITRIINIIGIPMPPAPGVSFSWLSQPVIVPSVVRFSFILVIVAALVSSLYPAYKASRLEIAEALRHT